MIGMLVCASCANHWDEHLPLNLHNNVITDLHVMSNIEPLRVAIV